MPIYSVRCRLDLVAWILKVSREGLLWLAYKTQSIIVAVSKNDLVVTTTFIRARTMIKASLSSCTILRSS